jgi:kumamolisin
MMQNRAALHHYLKRRSAGAASDHAGAGPWKIADLCAAYQWPTGAPGGGVIGIIELGGGWLSSDVQAFCTANNVPLPAITDISVDGSRNAPGSDADGEVALDIQIAAAAYSLATGKPATIRMYWSRDITSAIIVAANDGCDVCSISWGADEAEWGLAAATALEAAAQAGNAAGMVVLAAAGDNDSSDGGPGAANVDLPASAPHVIGCGGTSKTADAEVVWNNNPGNADGSGTGGGYSMFFTTSLVPGSHWQMRLRDPGARGIAGRMVPDVAANADPNTGYEIVVGRQSQVVGGTSAVAPLYAGLLAACGQKRGDGLAVKLHGNPAAFTDITQGDNGAYQAAVGPDPCTGLGAPIGTAIAALLR